MGVLGRLRRRQVEQIRAVNKVTEQATLAAGATLGQLVSIGRAYVAGLREVLDRKVTGEGAALACAIQAQGTRVRTDLEVIVASLDEHCAEVTRANECATQIATSASAIALLAGQARMLSMNARIEAARAGHDGFAVIAQEMKRLSDTIAETNAIINDLSRTLGASLPAMRAQSESLGVATTRLAGELRGDLGNVETQLGSLRQDVRDALESADRTINEMVDASHTALSQLQFQDVVAQQLLTIDTWAHDAQASLAEPAEHAEIEPPVQVQVGGSDGHTAQPAGEVILF